MPPEIFDRHSRRLLEASETETKQVSQLFDWYSQLFDLFLPNYLGQFTHLVVHWTKAPEVLASIPAATCSWAFFSLV